MAEHPKSFAKPVYVLPNNKNDKKSERERSKKVYGNRDENIVDLNQEALNQVFNTYSLSEDEAKKIITPNMVNKLVDSQKMHPEKVFFGFVKSHIVVAISHLGPLFEPSIFSKVTCYDMLKEYFETIVLAMSIVNELSPKKDSPPLSQR